MFNKKNTQPEIDYRAEFEMIATAAGTSLSELLKTASDNAKRQLEGSTRVIEAQNRIILEAQERISRELDFVNWANKVEEAISHVS